MEFVFSHPQPILGQITLDARCAGFLTLLCKLYRQQDLQGNVVDHKWYILRPVKDILEIRNWKRRRDGICKEKEPAGKSR